MQEQSKFIQQLLEWIDEFSIACTLEHGLSNNTATSYKSDLSGFAKFLKDTNKHDLTKSTIKKYFLKLHTDKISRSSFLRKISALNNFFSFLLINTKIRENPISTIPRPKKEKVLPKFLQYSEIEKLIEYCNANQDKYHIRMSCIITILKTTGMRISELLNLKVHDIEIDHHKNQQFVQIVGKGNKERLVPLHQDALDVIQKYLSIRSQFMKNSENNSHLFPSRSKNQRLTREQVGMSLKKISIACGLDHHKISPHIIRHSFATNLCSKKIDLRVLQEILGHSDISTTEIYIDVMDKEIIDFVNTHHPLNKTITESE